MAFRIFPASSNLCCPLSDSRRRSATLERDRQLRVVLCPLGSPTNRRLTARSSPSSPPTACHRERWAAESRCPPWIDQHHPGNLEQRRLEIRLHRQL